MVVCNCPHDRRRKLPVRGQQRADLRAGDAQHRVLGVFWRQVIGLRPGPGRAGMAGLEGGQRELPDVVHY